MTWRQEAVEVAVARVREAIEGLVSEEQAAAVLEAVRRSADEVAEDAEMRGFSLGWRACLEEADERPVGATVITLRSVPLPKAGEVREHPALAGMGEPARRRRASGTGGPARARRRGVPRPAEAEEPPSRDSSC
ncbi:hypothetical protein [Allostreptomyces psammosilenae]|uniref:Uncharacterized protein n=1 Tax=Allostreptomyces psammosilenae TaxID=1892865 RepID=A0A853A417_9ACTN|nr:hypothetical protein [Allostreptomyces psammosilenae]NYI05242.1 hypothetical protein [Allostreptomyces psammosilenae]